MTLALNKLKKRPSIEGQLLKPKRTINRFDGLSEEEVQKYTLEDILEPSLDLVFVGINPSLMAAHRGRYYAGPGNHFYKLLHASQLVPKFVSFEEDHKLLNYKIGLTNIVARATRSSADLKKPEIKEGSAIVREKLKFFKPKVAVFNGKCIYEVFANKTSKSEFYFGLQPEGVGDTAIWVVPSSSARCAHFPRMVDKLHFYTALKKYLSFVKGEISQVNTQEFIFEGKCKQSIPSTSKMWRRKGVSAFIYGGRVANKETVCLDTSEDDLATVNSTEFIVTQILGRNTEEEGSKKCHESQNEINSDKIDAPEPETSSSEEKMSQETKENKRNPSPRNIAAATGSNKEKNLKRRWKRSPISQVSFRMVKAGSNDDSMDFMNIIKQRLSEKKESVKAEEQIVQKEEEIIEKKDEINESKEGINETKEEIVEPKKRIVEKSLEPIKEGKKLKYANLRLNCGKRFLSMEMNPPIKSCAALDDTDCSASSD